jgi:methyltransferase-like protein
MSQVSLDQVFNRSENIVGRRIQDEFILVPLASRTAQVDSLYNLNSVGAFIWEQIDGVRSGEEIVGMVLERFDAERDAAGRDYIDFMEQLLSIKAVRAVIQP